MKKKLLSLAVALAMALTLLPTMAFAFGTSRTPASHTSLALAPLHDQDGNIKDEDLYDHTASKTKVEIADHRGTNGEAATDGADYTVTITVNDLQPHKNANGNSSKVGSWVGVTIPNPGSATYVEYNYAASIDSLTTNSKNGTVGTNENLNFYIDAGENGDAASKKFLRVAWYASQPSNGNPTATTDTIYELKPVLTTTPKEPITVTATVGDLSQQTGTQKITVPITLKYTADPDEVTATAVKSAISVKATLSPSTLSSSPLDVTLVEAAAVAPGDTTQTFATATETTISLTNSYFTIPANSVANATNVSVTLTFASTDEAAYTPPASQTVSLASYTNPNPSGTTGDVTKAVDPTNVKYDPETGELTWTMKGITSKNAVETANDWFYVGFMTTKGAYIDNGVAAELQYQPTHSRSPISISGNTFSATVPQPASLKAGTKYDIYVENRSKQDGEMVTYRFTAVSASQVVVDIPKASSVKTVEDVQDVVAELAAENVTALASSVVNDSTAKKNFNALEKKVQDIMNVEVETSVARSAPESLQKGVSIQGAAFNAEGSNVTMTLSVDSPSKTRTVGEDYKTSVTPVQFSMSLSHTKSSSLEVPVIIRLPKPKDMSKSHIVVLHYPNSGNSFDEIWPVSIDSSYIYIPVTSFSDFVITETTKDGATNGNLGSSSGSSSSKTSSSSSKGGASGGASVAPGTVVVAPPATSTPSAPSTVGGFSDVPTSNTFASQIDWAQSNGYMGGYSDGTFRPNNGTNRQQIWMVLGRMAGASPATMAEAREWAISAGVSDGANPEGGMSRQQMITMLYRFAQTQGITTEGAADLSGYADNGVVASYAQEALAWGVANGIITGTTDGKLNPEGIATRAHFAAFLYRYATLPAAPAPAETPEATP